jgi:hypothetical protein
MREKVIQLLAELDQFLVGQVEAGEHFDLYLIGRSSLIVRLDLTVATDDVDIVQITPGCAEATLEELAIQQFGEGSANAQRLGLYLERVPQGWPPLPQGFRRRCTEKVPGEWQILRPWLLEYHDFAVTKLKRFSAKDRQDLKILCNYGLVTPEGLMQSLDNAFAFGSGVDEDEGQKCAYENAQVVITYLKKGHAF